jgi:hypothetical protein
MSIKKLTAEEIIERLKEVFGDDEGGISNYAYGEFHEVLAWDEIKDLSKEDRTKVVEDAIGLGEIKEVEQYGGEGEGDRWWTVKHFVDHDVYIKTRGYYSSYNGTDFYYGLGTEVKPTEKTITVFE